MLQSLAGSAKEYNSLMANTLTEPAPCTPSTDIPANRRLNVAHTQVVCKVRPTKDDPNWTHITTGGNSIAYHVNKVTKTGSLKLVKGILNSVCSHKKLGFSPMTYLTSILEHPWINQNMHAWNSVTFLKISAPNTPSIWTQWLDLLWNHQMHVWLMKCSTGGKVCLLDYETIMLSNLYVYYMAMPWLGKIFSGKDCS